MSNLQIGDELDLGNTTGYVSGMETTIPASGIPETKIEVLVNNEDGEEVQKPSPQETAQQALMYHGISIEGYLPVGSGLTKTVIKSHGAEEIFSAPFEGPLYLQFHGGNRWVDNLRRTWILEWAEVIAPDCSHTICLQESDMQDGDFGEYLSECVKRDDIWKEGAQITFSFKCWNGCREQIKSRITEEVAGTSFFLEVDDEVLLPLSETVKIVPKKNFLKSKKKRNIKLKKNGN